MLCLQTQIHIPRNMPMMEERCPVVIRIPPTLSSQTFLVGRRSAMRSGFSGSAWSYDAMGRPLQDTRVNSGGGSQPQFNVKYSYNLDGSLASLTYPSGNVLTYTPGGAGRPLGVSDATNTYAASAA